MDVNSYVFLGVGVAISVLGFFLKKEARKAAELEERVKFLEVQGATNLARDDERWTQVTKVLEDRRDDVRQLYEKLSQL